MDTRRTPRSEGKRNGSSAFGERGTGRGTGKRSKAELWDQGVSGKQNKTFFDGSNKNRSVAYIFADSQLRPVVQGDVKLSQGPIQYIINSTPGGTCRHVEEELLDFSCSLDPDIVVIAAGTNNIGFGLKPLDLACRQFRSLLKSALRMSPQVVATSITPRLDRKGRLVKDYNFAFSMICQEEGVSWLDITDSFPTDDTRLWARDGLHISECSGLPRLFRVMHRRMASILWPYGSPSTSARSQER